MKLSRKQIERKRKFKTSYIKDDENETALKCCIDTDKGKLCTEIKGQMLYWGEKFNMDEFIKEEFLKAYDKKKI